MHHAFCTFFSRRCTTTTWNQEPKISRFLFLHLDTVLPDSTSENFPNKINEQMSWNWIRSTKFERVRIHFCDVFGLLSFRNFATMATLSLRRKIILHFLSPHLGFSAMLSISFVDSCCCWNHSVEQNVSQKLLKIADTLKQKNVFWATSDEI